MDAPFIIIDLLGVILNLLLLIYLQTVQHPSFTKRTRFLPILIINCLILADDCWLTVNLGHPGTAYYYGLQVLTFALYVLQYSMLFLMADYVANILARRFPGTKRNWVLLVQGLSVLVIIGCVINLFTGKLYLIDKINNDYQRGPWFPYCMVVTLICLVTTSVQIIKYRKGLSKIAFLSLLSLLTLPLGGVLLQLLTPRGQYVNIALAMAVIVIIFTDSIETRGQLEQLQLKVLQDQIYLLNAQIKPHFLFNSLTIIRSLIHEDPDLAEDAVNHLTKLLRLGLNINTDARPVSIKHELDYVKNYLYLMKLRFGDQLNIVYDIDPEEDFLIPFLSVQPLVENAIKHGIRSSEGAGTLQIRVCREQGKHIVDVIDNGAGFDVEKMLQKRKKKTIQTTNDSVGLINVEKRLDMMCKGKLTFTSAIGQGTTARITIPE